MTHHKKMPVKEYRGFRIKPRFILEGDMAVRGCLDATEIDGNTEFTVYFFNPIPYSTNLNDALKDLLARDLTTAMVTIHRKIKEYAAARDKDGFIRILNEWTADIFAEIPQEKTQ